MEMRSTPTQLTFVTAPRRAHYNDRYGSIATRPSQQQVWPCPLSPESGSKFQALAFAAIDLCRLDVATLTATINSQPTTSPSSSWQQSASGYALVSPRPKSQNPGSVGSSRPPIRTGAIRSASPVSSSVSTATPLSVAVPDAGSNRPEG